MKVHGPPGLDIDRAVVGDVAEDVHIPRPNAEQVRVRQPAGSDRAEASDRVRVGHRTAVVVERSTGERDHAGVGGEALDIEDGGAGGRLNLAAGGIGGRLHRRG